MKDETTLNVALVQEVERHPVLYNHTHPGYVSRDLQEVAWNEVAEALAETVANCKGKWNSLRGSLCRHLRQLQTNGSSANKRPYYMAEHMAYLVPFTRVRPYIRSSISNDHQAASSEMMTSSDDHGSSNGHHDPEQAEEQDNTFCQIKPEMEEFVYDENNEVENVHFNNGASFTSHFLESEAPLPAKRPRLSQSGAQPDPSTMVETTTTSSASKQEVVPEVTSPANPTRRRKSETSYSEESNLARIVSDSMEERNDADMNFLRSILPDIKKMNDSQKSKFKIDTLKMIHSTLYEA